ncbi:MAG TPA: AMP-binding protein [Steroidobacteraceae bacterium]|nr:AMP-binding protein [Steroidobacteraceae bacterium]
MLHVAAALPQSQHILNVCNDRYRFTVSFAACLVAGRTSLLPPSLTPEVIRQLGTFASDVACITDDGDCAIDLPLLRYPQVQSSLVPWHRPQIAVDHVAAYLFTSGSTGTPLPYRKTWGRLASCVREEARRFGLLDGRCHSIVGTVPSQHMFGFESTVLLPLQSGNALYAERPFHPADICALLAVAPRPRVLVSTPVHLRTLLAAGVALPVVDLVVSSTAPLSQDLAREVEAGFDTNLMEIYGSTETGQMATRRTARTDVWQLCDGVTLTTVDDRTQAQGAHIEQPTPLGDLLELQDAQHFLLRGRSADLVNIAGKRSSLAHLNHQLLAVAGVVDGAFVLREDEQGSSTGVSRVAAVVVAPTLTAAGLMGQLRRRIDPIFLPRPLLFVDKLPRNDTGKLPHAALLDLVTRSMQRSE